MATLAQQAVHVVLVGLGATAFMDLWLACLKRLGARTQAMALIGRWVGHWRRGIFFHAAIADAPPVRHERALGWAVHYIVGIAFAALLVLLEDAGWMHRPTLGPAIALGIATVAAPWLVMQPAMGAGIASARTPAPFRNRAKSLATHFVFGLGLYLAAWCLALPE
ncbi:DUF2938 domain-containing protein [[Pseudomonas] boreopolis]|uniref:DUF2938 domain-containing protein n=1 Tax=Xanthomonas boreopolis TaxID=86183 RepID=UPI003D50140D